MEDTESAVFRENSKKQKNLRHIPTAILKLRGRT